VHLHIASFMNFDDQDEELYPYIDVWLMLEAPLLKFTVVLSVMQVRGIRRGNSEAECPTRIRLVVQICNATTRLLVLG